MKLCQGVQYGDYKGKIFADENEINRGVLEKIKQDKKIKSKGKIIGLQFFDGKFKLVELINEYDNYIEVKRYDIDLSFDELMRYFKRFSFCLTIDKYLEKDIIL